MDNALRDYARGLEQRLRPLASTAIAAAHGGRDSNRNPLPGIEDRLHGVPDQIDALAAWVRDNVPEGKPSRGGRR